jgi:hypothetical protein
MAIFQRGDVFAKCTVVRLLGAGRVAEVYEVVTANGARRALKVLKEDAPLTSKLRARLAQECDILATIEHLNVVRFYDAGVEQGRVWLLIELVEGTDLERIRLDAGGPLPVERAVRLVRQACEGVAAAHALKVIHRDLSPGNLLVTGGDLVKVVDFGSAKITHYGVQTTRETVFVSGLYMAPDFLQSGVAEPSSDVFSLALVLYVLLAGAHPLTSSPITLLDATRRQMAFDARNAPALATLGHGIPGDLSLLLRRALSRDAAQRPTMTQMAAGLGAVLEPLLAPRRKIARNLPVPHRDEGLVPTELAMPAFPETGRSAVLPPDAPAVSTLRCAAVPARPAKTMPMEAMEAPAERGSTAVPVERAASAAPANRRGRGLAAAAGVLLLGMSAAAWVLAGRVGGGGDVVDGAGSAAAPAAPAPAIVPTVTATASALPPATTAVTTTTSRPSAPPARRRGAPAKVKPPFP